MSQQDDDFPFPDNDAPVVQDVSEDALRVHSFRVACGQMLLADMSSTSFAQLVATGHLNGDDEGQTPRSVEVLFDLDSAQALVHSMRESLRQARSVGFTWDTMDDLDD